MTSVPGKSQRRWFSLRNVLIVALSVFLAGCDPAIFKKPSQDLLSELKSIRSAYFSALKIRRDAQFERINSQQRVAYWVAPALALDKEVLAKDADQLQRIRKRDLLPADDLQVRQRAFDVLETYAGTLVALASNDDVEAISKDLSALSGDLKALAEVAKSVKVLAGAGGAIESWLPAISGALGAVQKIAEVVGNVVRTNAIRDVVQAAHDPVKKLLRIFAEESKVANQDAVFAYGSAIQEVEARLKAGISDPSSARAASEYLVVLRTNRDALRDAPSLAAAFFEAEAMQDALYKSVTKPDVQDLVRQAQQFRKQVQAAKLALDSIP